MMFMKRLLGGLVAPFFLATPIASAQWSSSPAANLSLADGASDQTQPKLVATSDGGTFLSWFDGIGTGFDVRAQRFDAAGNEVMAHNGVLVADRGFSSTQDYGISIDATDNVLLAFRDDRLVGTQITAAKVSPTGTLAWGAFGVQLTNTTSFVANPKIAGTSDGGAVVAWTQDSTSRLQKLDATGAPQWGSDVILAPPAGSYTVADLHASGTDVIVSLVHQTGGFTSPKRLVTQKLDLTGAPLWGVSPVSVFDVGSLQFGNFPSFVPDGAGGAVFAWYGTSPLQCYAQRILANGSEGFAHNGVAVSTNATQIRVNPSVSFVSETGETVVSWVEQNSLQSQFGVSSQKFDATGNRLWGPTGIVHLPLGTTELGNVRNASGPYATFVFWVATPSFGQGVLRALRVDASGATDVAEFDVASTPSTKSRLAVTQTTTSQAFLAWTDDRVDASDIFGQNVNCDATLGAPSTSAAWTDLGNALAGFAGPPLLQGSGTLCGGDSFTIAVSNARPNSSAALIVGLTPLSLPFLGGVLVPNPDLVFVGLPTGPSGSIVIDGAIPSIPAQFEFYLQYWITDAAGLYGFAASNGLKATAP